MGGATVPITSSPIQGIQVFLQAQEGGAHPLQHKHHLLRGYTWEREGSGAEDHLALLRTKPDSQCGRDGRQSSRTPHGTPVPSRAQVKALCHQWCLLLSQQQGLVPPAGVESWVSLGSMGAARLRFRPVTDTLATLGQAAAVVSASRDSSKTQAPLASQGSGRVWTPPPWGPALSTHRRACAERPGAGVLRAPLGKTREEPGEARKGASQVQNSDCHNQIVMGLSRASAILTAPSGDQKPGLGLPRVRLSPISFRRGSSTSRRVREMPGISSADMKVPTRARVIFTPRPSAIQSKKSLGREGPPPEPPPQGIRERKAVAQNQGLGSWSPESVGRR